LFSLGWVWHISASFSSLFLLSSWRTWEKLLDAKVRFEMERLHMRSLLHLLKEKQNQIGVSFESASPTLFQLLPLVGNKTQKKIGVGEVQKSLGSWKTATHSRLTYATGRNHSLDDEVGRVEGKWWGGFCIWSLAFAGGGVFGVEVFLCWFVFGHYDFETSGWGLVMES
jgi:hypothetical protein